MLWKQPKGRSERAKILETYRLDRSDAMRLRKAALAIGKTPGTVTREVLLRWLDLQESESNDNFTA